MMKVRAIIKPVFLLSLGCMGGVLLSVIFAEELVYIDYDSGRLKREVVIGPILIKEAPMAVTVFSEYPVPSGRQYLTGEERWVMAQSGGRYSLMNYNYEGGSVLNMTHSIANFFPKIGLERASKLKEECLLILNNDGASALGVFVREKEKELFKEL